MNDATTTQALDRIADEVGERGVRADPRRLGRLVREWRAQRRSLAGTAEGRAAVEARMGDPRVAVRLWSAAAVLFWDPEAARPVLSEIRDAPLVYDLHSITAKHTLLDYDAGRLQPEDALPGTVPSGDSA